jgi:xanthine dehydrogenase YagT iron-sulfur-binding subunit
MPGNDDPTTPIDKPGLNRRDVLVESGAWAMTMSAMSKASTPATPDAKIQGLPADAGTVPVQLMINGQRHPLMLDSRTSLLDALRLHVGLTGTKKGCDHGQCGACTVHIDGHRALACMTFAVAVRGAVTTIEGLSADGTLHPMQQAFIDNDAFQCGYCTPGQIMSAVACVQEGHAQNDDDIREFMSGNLCRCAAYPHIVAAIKQAKGKMRSG